MRWALLLPLALAACVSAAVRVAPPPVVATVLNPAIAGIQIPVTSSLAAIEDVPLLGTFANIQRRAGNLDRLSGPAPLTVFAATDAAFARLAPGVATRLLDADNRAVLTRLATYHLVPGRLDAADLRRRVAQGAAALTTLAGDTLVVGTEGPALVLTDANGNSCYIEVADIRLSNGILHTVNGVLVPAL